MNFTEGKTFVIAEIGTAHLGNINKALELIEKSLDAGADAVKFQWVYASEILHPKTGNVLLPGGNIPLYNRFKELEVSPEFFAVCRDFTKKKGGSFICSPFGIKSLRELLEIEPDWVKIASPELNHIPMLKELAALRKGREKDIKVILSSGVSLKSDIKRALEILGTQEVSLLHCVTSYPAPEEDYNLRLLKNLKSEFKINVGVSDHSKSPVLVPCLGISQGASVIEKHITISNDTEGLDDPVALTAEQFSFMCHFIHQCDAVMNRYGKEEGEKQIIKQLADTEGMEKIEKILGTGEKCLAPSEKANYGRTNRSLHYMKSLKKGHKIQEGDVEVLRTEKILTPGISPEYLEKVIGKTLCKDVEDGEGVQFCELEDFEEIK